MVLYLNRQTLETWFFGQTFRDSPTLEHAVFFEPKVKVMTACVMLPDHKSRFIHRCGPSIRLFIPEAILIWRDFQSAPLVRTDWTMKRSKGRRSFRWSEVAARLF